MSQPNENYPAIQYIGADGSSYFDPQAPQGGNDYHQWRHPGPGPVRNTPSPSGTVSTAMTASMYYNGHPGLSPSVHSSDSRINTDFQGLALLAVPNQHGRPRSTMNSPSDVDHISPIYPYPPGFAPNSTGPVPYSPNPQASTNHIMTMVDERTDATPHVDSLSIRMFSSAQHDEPWNPMRVAYSSETSADRSSFSGHNRKFGKYRTHNITDIDSVVGPRSDSGYYTHPAPLSVISNEPELADQDLPSDMLQMPNLNVSSAPSESTEYVPPPSDQASQYSAPSLSQSKNTYKCSKCQEVSKCPSDYKKHMLKHDKPHTCDVHGCRRAAQGKGFTTINDLQRHKKSVHRIGVERDSYQCASEHCRNRGKIWPRLDNFKQHISRMHKDEDEVELIRKSAYRGPIPPSAMSQADMLAGIGVEGQVAGNELDDPASGISLTPDQDENRWATNFDPGSRKYTQEIDRMCRYESDQFLRAPDIHAESNKGRSTTPLSSIDTHSKKPQRQDSLKVLADVASYRQLSSAPQTKAEQQRQVSYAEQQRMALQKFGKALLTEYQADPSADGTDLVLRVLSGTTQQRRDGTNAASRNPSIDDSEPSSPRWGTTMTKTEAIKASQAISNLFKQSRGSPFTSRSRRSSRISSSDKVQCSLCEVTLARACDMKKHMKRHTKPYGCTYPKCHKRFGAKSDWKRHENSQHFQMESFPCQSVNPGLPAPCGELFHRLELFKQHLKDKHQIIRDSDAQEVARACRIGKNYQGQFWCGFCRTIVKLKTKRNAAWDERFDHIDAHFNKEKRGIEQWLCMEAGKTKGEILKDMDPTRFDEEDADEDGEGEPDDSPPASRDGLGDGSVQLDGSSPRTPPLPPSIPIVENITRKRPYPAEDAVMAPASKRRRTEVDRYCCSCGNGPWSGNMYVFCMDCEHHLCSSCPADGMGGLDGGIMLG